MRHSAELYVAFTFVDVLFNLRMEYDRLKLKEGKLSTAMLSSVYCGEIEYKASSLKKTTETTMRLPPSVITSSRYNANFKEHLLFLSNARLNLPAHTAVQMLVFVADCRQVAFFSHTSCIRSAQY